MQAPHYTRFQPLFHHHFTKDSKNANNKIILQFKLFFLLSSSPDFYAAALLNICWFRMRLLLVLPVLDLSISSSSHVLRTLSLRWMGRASKALELFFEKLYWVIIRSALAKLSYSNMNLRRMQWIVIELAGP